MLNSLLNSNTQITKYPTFADFPATGSTSLLYLDEGTSALYSWNGSAYVEVGQYPQVTTYADLPAAADASGKVYLVTTSTGVWPLNNPAGFYYSNGSVWTKTSGLTGVLTASDVIDNLTSTVTNKPLSANQGRVLNEAIVPSNQDHNLLTNLQGGAAAEYYHLTSAEYTGLSGLSNSLLTSSDSRGNLASVSNLASWIAGTSNRISVADDLDGTVTLDIDSSYVGQATITTLGTVSSGTWQGDTIAVNQGGTGQTSYTNGQLLIGNTTGNTLTKATLTGTANQITVANGAGTITLSTPQAIDIAAADFTVAGASITDITQGSILFAGTSGAVSQDNSNLFWDDSNNRLGIGTAAPNSPASIFVDSEDLLRLTRNSNTADGTAAAGILFGVRTFANIQQKGAILFKRTGTFGQGDLVFANNNTTDNSNASLADAVMTIQNDGNIAITGTIDGVDLAALQVDVDGFPDELKNLTTAEIQQVENIGATTISSTQWGYLGALDQALATTDSPTFDDLTINGKIRVDRGSDEIALVFEDSGGDDTVYHTVNDGQGNYCIMLGVDGSGQHVVTGDGTSKILMTGHGADGEISLNAGPTGTSGANVVFNIALSLDSADQFLRIGNPADNVGLDGTAGNIIADVDGDLITQYLRARDGNGLNIEDDGGNTAIFVEDLGRVGIGMNNPVSHLHLQYSSVNANDTVGLTIENTSSGDAVTQFSIA